MPIMSRAKVVAYLTKAGFKNIAVDNTLQYDNIYLAKLSD